METSNTLVARHRHAEAVSAELAAVSLEEPRDDPRQRDEEVRAAPEINGRAYRGHGEIVGRSRGDGRHRDVEAVEMNASHCFSANASAVAASVTALHAPPSSCSRALILAVSS